MRWLVVSLVLSLVLTVVLNIGVRAFPGAADRTVRRLAGLATPPHDDRRGDARRVRVYVPWKAMVVASVVLTVVLNLLLAVR